MGCDIHMYVEKLVSGKWTAADKWERDPEDDNRLSVPYGRGIYGGRNYNLFAILANVRNGRGFAGLDTGDGFNPIALPKGLPDDVSPEIKECAERWGVDGHSHSFFTVAELLAYDWTQHTKLRGVVNGVEYIEWSSWRRARGMGPESYCGGVSGSSVKNVTVDEMQTEVERALKVCQKEKLHGLAHDKRMQELVGQTYAPVEWTEQYFSCAGEFLSRTMPVLWRLGAFDQVRIVFWFDN